MSHSLGSVFAFAACTALSTLIGCGSSTDDDSGNGALASGGQNSSGQSDTTRAGGVSAAAGGSNALGATGGASVIVATGGSLATSGGSSSTSTGGSSTLLPGDQLCSQVCALLATRTTPLACAPTACVSDCNSTYTKLAAGNAECSNAFVALYQCGLNQSADRWSCYDVAVSTLAISIPIPPSQTKSDPCNAQYNKLTEVIWANLTTCAFPLAS